MASSARTVPIAWACRYKLLCWGVLPALLAVPSVARADDGMELMLGYAMHVGAFGEYGKAEYSGGKGNPGSTTAFGIRYYERQGLITGTITAVMIAMGAAQQANAATSVESHQSGNYVVTTTTYHSQAERAEILAAGAESANAAFSSRNQSFDMEIYSRNLGGNASGWKINSFYGFPFWKMMFEIGAGFGSIDTAMAKAGEPIYTSWAYLGMPMRFDLAAGPFWMFLEADWNFFGYGGNAAATTQVGDTLLVRKIPVLPWKFGIETSVFDGRLFAEAVATTSAITAGEAAIKGTLGLRF